MGSGIISVADDYQNSLHAHNSFNQKATGFSPAWDFSTTNQLCQYLSNVSEVFNISLAANNWGNGNSNYVAI